MFRYLGFIGMICVLIGLWTPWLNGRPLSFMQALKQSRLEEWMSQFTKSALFRQIPSESSQILWVSVRDWEDKEAQLQLLQRRRTGEWETHQSPMKVKIGRKGVAVGVGRHEPAVQIPERFIKKEGDAKTPLGVFDLPYAFGQEEAEIAKQLTSLPFLQMTEFHAGVDDESSRFYNQVVDSRMVAKDWGSAEKMVLRDGTYHWGIFVSHNPKGHRGLGSCIFIHIKKANGDSTSGCVAMSRQEIEGLLRWMDPKRHPVLVVSLDSAY